MTLLKKISWWIKIPIFFVILIIGLFQFSKLQYILYPLPEDDGFSLVGHEAIIKIGENSDLSDGQLYKYVYCDPKECEGGKGIEKISNRNFAYVEKLNLTKQQIQNYPKIQSEDLVSDKYRDIIGSWEECQIRKVGGGVLPNPGCIVWYEHIFSDKDNSSVLRFGEIKVGEKDYHGRKSYFSGVNNKSYLGIKFMINYNDRKRDFDYIYIYSHFSKSFSLLAKKQDGFMELVDFK